LDEQSDGRVGIRAALLAVAVALTLAGCTSGNSSRPSEAPACPHAWAAGWKTWAGRVDATVYCPTWLPSPIDARIGGQWSTESSAGRHWQLGFVWRDEDFSGLVHVVFEGAPEGDWPLRCGGPPCFAGRSGSEDVNGRHVVWYDHDLGSSSGHVAAVFHAGGHVYIVSMHVFGDVGPARTRAMVRRIVAGLVPVRPPV
jgi:hypothetical protein